MAFDNTTAQIGYGKHLAYSDTSNGSYTTIDGTVEINLPERELGSSESTNDDSPDYHKQMVPTLFDPGSVKFSYRYNKTQFATVDTIFLARTLKYFKVTLPDNSTAIFPGFLMKHDLPVAIEDVLTVEGEIQVTGKMAWTAG